MQVDEVPQNMKWDANGNTNGYLSEDEDFEGGDSVSKLYERSRIKALAEERENVQKKTFTKWMNSHLVKVNDTVDDLYFDLRDGKKLLKLLEMLSCEKLDKPTRGRMRIHCLVNVDKALNFLIDQHVHLENVGAHDIVDGNSRITLGLIWTIILRFQIQDIVLDDHDMTDAKSAKDALLLWCQMKTAGYPNVNVRNFTSSWRDGLAFNALINKHCPELVDFSKVNRSAPLQNLNQAFDVADELGIPKLLDPEDINTEQPDEKSIMTYVVTLYHHFNKMKTDNVQCKRIGKFLNQAISIEDMINEYEKLTTDLLEWIEHTNQLLDERMFANSLSGVQQQLAAFNTYRISEKPPKFQEKGNLEMRLFIIHSEMRANNLKPYTPEEGKLISDINKAWERLEKAEHERELCLREELIRQEKLGQLASRFDRKTGMREAWLVENQKLVTQDNFGDDLAAVEAATKKHEAIETDILSYEERVNAVVTVAQELTEENYHDIERIDLRKNNVIKMWHDLLDLLKMRRNRLELSKQMQNVFQEILYLLDWIDEISNRLKSDDYGKHLLGVDDLLQKHGLLEADIRVLEVRKNQVLEQAQIFIDGDFEESQDDYKPADPKEVEARCQELKDSYQALLELAGKRHIALQESRKMWQFFWEMEDDKEWIKEKSQLMSSPDLGHDLSSVERLLRKHKALEEEVRIRQQTLEEGLQRGEELIKNENWGKDKITERIHEMKTLWAQLVDLTAERRQRLEESLEFYQLLTDCDDADAYMTDTIRIVKNEDVGNKISITKTLIKTHEDLQEELANFRQTLDQLRSQGTKISEYPETDASKIFNQLDTCDKLYDELVELSKIRHQKLLDALSMYKLFDVADSVKTWISEKEKLLVTLVPSDELEEMEVIRQRFDYFEAEMRSNAEKVSKVNELSKDLVSEHPNADNIMRKQDELNQDWNELADMVEKKKQDIDTNYKYNQYLIEAQETANWIVDKEKLIESTDELGNDLDGIMQMQRKLGGLQRDLKAIEAKVEHLAKEADYIEDKKPEVTEVIEPERQKLQHLWQELKDMLQQRDDRLSDSSELQRFLQDLDHFQMWLSKTQTTVASEDVPNNLQEAEKLLQQHNQLKEDIAVYKPEFERLIAFGRKVTDGQTDPQYVLMSQRLSGIEESWEALGKMVEDREIVLNESVAAQTFFKDSHAVDVLLSKLENVVAKSDTPTTIEATQEAIKQHENLNSNAASNDAKIDAILEAGSNLVDDNNFNLEKIQAKCEQIKERREQLRKKSIEKADVLMSQLELQEFCQEVDDVEEWIAEKLIVASDDTSRELANVSARYGRFKAFEEEIGANKEKIEKVIHAAEELKESHPEHAEKIQPKIDEMVHQWEELNRIAQEKSMKMADANRETIFQESAKTMNEWITDIESQVILTEEDETELGLVEINEQMKDQDKKDQELEQKRKMLQDMETHAVKLKEQYPDREEEIEQMQQEVRVKLTQVEAPLTQRRGKLEKQKRVRQFLRNIEDEKQWVEEKINLVQNNGKIGDSLLTVQQLTRRLKTLNNEVENHKPRIEIVCRDGEDMIQERHPQSDKFRYAITELWNLWDDLQQKLLERHTVLEDNLVAQQYLFDASEAESWMGEQELYLMTQEKPKDEQGSSNINKKHQNIEKMIENYADEIRSLGERSQLMTQTDHPFAEVVAQKQAKVDKMYAGLRDLCTERHQRLEENTKLFSLLREIEDLEHWIAERTQLASSHEMGSDFEHCCQLRERFAEFAKDTNYIGGGRISSANELCDSLINQGHAESAEIAQWKDRVNEAWADLLELIETRIQLLKAAWDLHKFLSECQDLLDCILEKKLVIPEEVGRDAKAVAAHQRKHQAFEQEVSRLGQQVESSVETTGRLLPLYAGQKERLICDRRDELLQAWRELQVRTEWRKVQLLDGADFHRFLAMIRELLSWIAETRTQMESRDKPRDVAGVELLVNNHRSLKAEIDAREENFSICFSLGRTLLNRRHPRENDIREKCIELVTSRMSLLDEWSDRYDHLHLILEVYQFARDAAVAESWLAAQKPFLDNHELGDNLDETLALLKKHVTFERALCSQEERFEALRKLTKLEERARELSPEAEAAVKRVERERRLTEALKEFQPIVEVAEVEPTVVHENEETPGGMRDSDVVDSTIDSGKKTGTMGSATGSKRGSGTVPAASKVTPTLLVRKHEWESTGKKASGRAWHELLVVLDTSSTDNESPCLRHYKDERHKTANDSYHHESPLSLSGGARAAPATDYTKRCHVLRLRLAGGGEYLYQARCREDMNAWIDAINEVAEHSDDPTSAGAARSSTLPHTAESGSSAASKKKFFTLGRKK